MINQFIIFCLLTGPSLINCGYFNSLSSFNTNPFKQNINENLIAPFEDASTLLSWPNTVNLGQNDEMLEVNRVTDLITKYLENQTPVRIVNTEPIVQPYRQVFEKQLARRPVFQNSNFYLKPGSTPPSGKFSKLISVKPSISPPYIDTAIQPKQPVIPQGPTSLPGVHKSGPLQIQEQDGFAFVSLDSLAGTDILDEIYPHLSKKKQLPNRVPQNQEFPNQPVPNNNNIVPNQQYYDYNRPQQPKQLKPSNHQPTAAQSNQYHVRGSGEHQGHPGAYQQTQQAAYTYGEAVNLMQEFINQNQAGPIEMQYHNEQGGQPYQENGGSQQGFQQQQPQQIFVPQQQVYQQQHQQNFVQQQPNIQGINYKHRQKSSPTFLQREAIQQIPAPSLQVPSLSGKTNLGSNGFQASSFSQGSGALNGKTNLGSNGLQDSSFAQGSGALNGKTNLGSNGFQDSSFAQGSGALNGKTNLGSNGFQDSTFTQGNGGGPFDSPQQQQFGQDQFGGQSKTNIRPSINTDLYQGPAKTGKRKKFQKSFSSGNGNGINNGNGIGNGNGNGFSEQQQQIPLPQEESFPQEPISQEKYQSSGIQTNGRQNGFPDAQGGQPQDASLQQQQQPNCQELNYPNIQQQKQPDIQEQTFSNINQQQSGGQDFNFPNIQQQKQKQQSDIDETFSNNGQQPGGQDFNFPNIQQQKQKQQPGIDESFSNNGQQPGDQDQIFQNIQQQKLTQKPGIKEVTFSNIGQQPGGQDQTFPNIQQKKQKQQPDQETGFPDIDPRVPQSNEQDFSGVQQQKDIQGVNRGEADFQNSQRQEQPQDFENAQLQPQGNGGGQLSEFQGVKSAKKQSGSGFNGGSGSPFGSQADFSAGGETKGIQPGAESGAINGNGNGNGNGFSSSEGIFNGGVKGGSRSQLKHSKFPKSPGKIGRTAISNQGISAPGSTKGAPISSQENIPTYRDAPFNGNGGGNGQSAQLVQMFPNFVEGERIESIEEQGQGNGASGIAGANLQNQPVDTGFEAPIQEDPDVGFDDNVQAGSGGASVAQNIGQSAGINGHIGSQVSGPSNQPIFGFGARIQHNVPNRQLNTVTLDQLRDGNDYDGSSLSRSSSLSQAASSSFSSLSSPSLFGYRRQKQNRIHS